MQQIVMLGSGSYGKVYSRNKTTAVKISPITEWDEMQSCIREINALLQLSLSVEKFFVKMIRSVYVNGELNLVLDRADMHLGQYPKKDLSADTICKWSVHLFRALKFLHDRGFYHRDLKPDNILVKGGTLWLCDFGLSRQFSNQAYHGTSYIVTRWYRSPELHAHIVKEKKKLKNSQSNTFNKLKYTASMDIWSMACIVYELVYNRVYCKGKNSKHCLDILQNKKGTIGGNMEKDVAERMDEKVKLLLVGALDMDEQQRFTIAECLHALEHFSDTELIAFQKRMKYQKTPIDKTISNNYH